MDSTFSKTQEFYDLMSAFEHTHKHLRLDREKRGDTPAGYWYQSGETNDIFKEYLNGYMTGRAVYLAHADEAKADAALGRDAEAELSRLRAANAELRKILARALAEEKCGADGVFFTVATECTEGRCWHFQARAALSRAAQAEPETERIGTGWGKTIDVAEQAKPETCVWVRNHYEHIWITGCGYQRVYPGSPDGGACVICGKKVEVKE